MTSPRILLFTLLAMIAFAGNSLLCRLALKAGEIDAASFTTLRLLSGAVMLCLLIGLRHRRLPREGGWLSAFALFAYAAAFSFAYLTLTAATGALLLFGAVQTLMIGYGLYRGERFHARQWLGLGLAAAGLVGLLLPGLSAPPLAGSLLMIVAGIAWGVYSLRGRGAGDPTLVTAGNFARALPFALATSLLTGTQVSASGAGVAYALASGAIASGLGYALWYAVLPGLKASTAATVQLSVPVLAAAGGVIFLGEAVSLRLALASVAVLGGIALVIVRRSSR